MASTRSKSLDERVDKQEQLITQLQSGLSDVHSEISQVRTDMESLGMNVANISTQLNDLAFKISALCANAEQSRHPHTTSSYVNSHPNARAPFNVPGIAPVNLKPLRIDVPRFDGGDPTGWIFKIQQFFDFHGTPPDQRLQVAPFYFDGKALAWYQWLFKNTQIPSWGTFLEALQTRFGPSELEDFQGQLTKLVQKGSVTEYQEEFETLSNKVNGISESFLLSCFISGLKPEIQHDVMAFQPQSLTKAIALAKIQESKLALKCFPAKLHSALPPLLPTPPLNQSLYQPYKTTSPKTFPDPSAKTPQTTNNTKPYIQQLTQSQIKERREKGLCFYCNDKYTIGHNCRASVHILIAPDDGRSEIGDMEDVQTRNQPFYCFLNGPLQMNNTLQSSSSHL